MSMNPEWKKKWVDALRSGEYEQGQKMLSSSAGFCCLGVLCDLVQQEHDHLAWVPAEVNEKAAFGIPTKHGSSLRAAATYEAHLLPKEVRDIVGLEEENPTLTTRQGSMQSMAYCNDRLGIPFTELADLIEEQL